mgnify:FL=1
MHIKICNEELKYHPPEYLHTEKRDKKDRVNNEALARCDLYFYILFAFCIFFRKIDSFDPVYKIPAHYRDDYCPNIVYNDEQSRGNERLKC